MYWMEIRKMQFQVDSIAGCLRPKEVGTSVLPSTMTELSTGINGWVDASPKIGIAPAT